MIGPMHGVVFATALIFDVLISAGHEGHRRAVGIFHSTTVTWVPPANATGPQSSPMLLPALCARTV